MISKPLAHIRRSLRPRVFIHEVPSIDLDAALRTGTPDAVDLTWEAAGSRTDRPLGKGGLFIAANGETQLGHIEYCFLNEAVTPTSEHAYITILSTSNGATKSRLRFICPECKSAKSQLYLHVSCWKCRSCHGLLYGSQYRADVEADFEVYDRLMVESSRPRRPYERQSVYQRKIADAKAKLANLGDVESSRSYSVQRPPSIVTTYLRGYERD